MPISVPAAVVQHVQKAATQVHDRDDEPRILPFMFIDRKQFKEYRRKLWNRDPHCTYCRQRIGSGNETLDHIKPQCEGGLDTPSNLVLACGLCNEAKGGRSATQWRDDLVAACEMIGGAN
ncbi:MAG TPA: HNH endonuclease signature motif containing protein [Schlesneria sp.]|jgi:5-methylcytosine-specific restriction endonuclease McrA